MKILVVPNKDLSFYTHLEENPLRLAKNWLWHFQCKHPTYESLYLTDLAIADSEVKVDYLGLVHSCYSNSSIPPNATNLSAYFDLTSWRGISYISARKNISSYDALLMSFEAWGYCRELVTLAKRYRKKIIVIDHREHPEAFIASQQELTRGLKYREDFDLYFKNHLPLGRRTDFILPLAPTPVRTERFKFQPKPIGKRSIYCSFSGITGKAETNQNRLEILNVFSRYPGSEIKIIEVNDHYSGNLPTADEYNDLLSNSQYSLSPAGRCWQTTRHVISGLAGCVPVMPFPDIETVDFEARHLENGVFYPMLLNLNEKQRRLISEQIAAECKQLSFDVGKMQKIADTWQHESQTKHTTFYRARYILEIIKSL